MLLRSNVKLCAAVTLRLVGRTGRQRPGHGCNAPLSLHGLPDCPVGPNPRGLLTTHRPVSLPAPVRTPCPPPQKEAQEYITSSDCPEYLRKAEARLGEEAERCGAYLDANSTEPKITRVVETELLKAQAGAGPWRGGQGGVDTSPN